MWAVRFDPSVGAEIQKVRPAVVVNVQSVGRLPLRIVVPITDWKPTYVALPWFVRILAAPQNGLSKESGADAFQVKSLANTRFVARLGRVARPGALGQLSMTTPPKSRRASIASYR